MIANAPTGAPALCRQGLSDLRAGRSKAAEARFEAALRLDPGHFESLWMLGIIQVQTGRPGAALATLDRAIALRPTVGGPHLLRGVALLALGRSAESIASHDRAVALQPGDFGAHYNRGLALAALERRQEAIASFDRAAALNPAMPEPHYNRAALLHEMKRLDEALASYDRAIALNPALAQPHYNRGLVLADLRRHREALESFDQAIALEPDHADAHTNRGCTLRALKRSEDAAASHERAIALKPGHAEAHYNLGVARGDTRRIEDAIACYDRAIVLKPDHADAHHNRALALLLLGRLEAGWQAYEWRWSLAGRQRPRFGSRPTWTGAADLTGKTLFVHHEQGFGDTLQFARFLDLVAARGAELIVSVQDPLVDLMKRLHPRVRILADAERPEHFDYVCPLLSLPLAFGTTLDTIPPPIWRAAPDLRRRARFADRLAPRRRLRVGVAWSGNPAHENDASRSLPFEALAPLLAADVEWVALQTEIRPSDTRAFAASGAMSFHGEALKTFSDTAALVELMDLVISVDTSIAHLAGSMGKPVWVLLPSIPDWRWLLDRSDSPWYPSARLFRQPGPGDWAGVIHDVGAALAATNFTAGPRGG